MVHLPVILLFIFLVWTNAKDFAANQMAEASIFVDDFVDKQCGSIVRKLFHRVHRVASSHHAPMDNMILGKPGYIAVRSPHLPLFLNFPSSPHATSFVPRSFQQSVTQQSVISKAVVRPVGAGTVATLPALRHRSRPFRIAANAAEDVATGEISPVVIEKTKCLSMKVPELRKELQALGIDTRTFVEKSEFVEALAEARIAGRAQDGTGVAQEDGVSQEDKVALEISRCQSMRVSELKKELEALGISSKRFLEKDEFVKALAEARASGRRYSVGTASPPQLTTTTRATTAAPPAPSPAAPAPRQSFAWEGPAAAPAAAPAASGKKSPMKKVGNALTGWMDKQYEKNKLAKKEQEKKKGGVPWMEVYDTPSVEPIEVWTWKDFTGTTTTTPGSS